MFIARLALLKLATFNGILKVVPKVRQLSFVRGKGSKSQSHLSKVSQHSASQESIRWLEQEAKQRKIHIHPAMCGHGGERWVERAPVDGYNHETRTVFQYHGCHWHGCLRSFPNDRHRIIAYDGTTREDRYQESSERLVTT